MIVTHNGVLLREVNTEADAFTEMRRFNNVNHIESNETEVSWANVEEKDSPTEIHRYKLVKMGTWFRIYYDSHPKLFERDPSKEKIIKRIGTPKDQLPYNDPTYHYDSFNDEFVYIFDDKVDAYLKDLEVRKAGGG